MLLSHHSQECFLPGHFRHPKTALTLWFRLHFILQTFFFPPSILLILASPSVSPLLSHFSPRLSVRHWQLRSWGARRGAEKTKIWFSGHDLDFLKIGWKIRKTIYPYITQSLPLHLQSTTTDQRGCSYQGKMRHLWQYNSTLFPPKAMSCLGTQCAKRRSQRSWCDARDWRKRTKINK